MYAKRAEETVMYNKISDDMIKRLAGIAGEKNVIREADRMLDFTHDEFPLSDIAHDPEVVVKPESTEQVAEIMKLADAGNIPVTPRGGATGLCGGCVPSFGGIVMSFENMKKVIEVDSENLMAVVEPGVTLKEFYEAVEKEGFFFPPHPGDESATVGGVIATNAGGARALKYGVIRNFIRGVEVVLPQGDVVNMGGKIIKNSTGYSMMNLMIGSEGTLGIVTKAVIALMPPPGSVMTLLVPYENLEDAISAIPVILRKKHLPMAMEFMENDVIEVAEDYLDKKWPCKGGSAYLMIILDAPGEDEAMKMAETIGEICLENNGIDVFIADDKKKQQNILDIRSHMYEALKAKTMEILDIVVPRAEIAGHVKKVHEVSEKYGIWLPTFGHAADGNVHTHLMKAGLQDGRLGDKDYDDWQEKHDKIREELFADAKARGGLISGEHGIGIAKKQYLRLSLEDRQIELMKGIKKLFDPNNVLNPGKIF